MYVYVSVRARQRHPDRGTGDKPRGRKRLGWPSRQSERDRKRERSAKGKGTFRVTSASRAQTLRHLAGASVFGHPLTLRLSARLARAVSVEDPSGKDVLMIPVRFSVIW